MSILFLLTVSEILIRTEKGLIAEIKIITNYQYHNKSYRHNLRGHNHDIKSLH